MKDAFVEFVRDLQGTVRARRQEKIREVELTWSANELASFRLFVMGLHSSEMTDVCYALADAKATPLLEILVDFAEKNPELMKIAFQSMEKTSGLARVFLAKKLLNSKKSEVRARTCEMLGSSGETARAMLEMALGDPSAKVQVSAIQAIVRGGHGSLGKKLIPLLRNHYKDVRFAALGALARLGEHSAALTHDVLVILQDQSEEEQVRRIAAGILVRASCQEGRMRLLEALRNPDAEYVLRLAAAESLSGYNDADCIKAVLRAAHDKDANIAKTARLSLSRKHSQDFVNILALCLEDPDLQVAVLAAELLGGLDVSFVKEILINRLKIEQRLPLVIALAEAMSNGGFAGAWPALIEKFHEKKASSPMFFAALADAAAEENLPEFASLFDEVADEESKTVIMQRLALFSQTSPITAEIKALAVRVLNGPNTLFHLSAATILAHVPFLEAEHTSMLLYRLAEQGEEPTVPRIVGILLRNRQGALADLFQCAPPSAAKLLVSAVKEASWLGEKATLLFHIVAHWVRNDVQDAKEALQAIAFLDSAALVAAMPKCPDQLFLIEAWTHLPEQDRFAHRPDLDAFFKTATPHDCLQGMHILDKLHDTWYLRAIASVAFTTKEPAVQQAAIALTRTLVLAK